MILTIVATVSETYATPNHANTQLTQTQMRRSLLARNIYMAFTIKEKEKKTTSDGRELEEHQDMT